MFHLSQFLKAATERHYTSIAREHSSIHQWNCLRIPVSLASDFTRDWTYDHSTNIEKILIHSCLKDVGEICFLLTLEFHYMLLQLFCIISIIISPREALKTLDSLIFGWFFFFLPPCLYICKTKTYNALSEILAILPFNGCGSTWDVLLTKNNCDNSASVHFLILLQNLIHNVKESTS